MQWWIEGGPWMYVILTVLTACLVGGAVSVALALGAFLAPVLKVVSRVLALLVALGALMPSCAGLVGWQAGRYRVDQALEFADPEHRAIIEEVGYAEARRPMEFGLGSSLCAVLPPALALVLSLAVPGRKSEEDDDA